jgi:hypothetical protein
MAGWTTAAGGEIKAASSPGPDAGAGFKTDQPAHETSKAPINPMAMRRFFPDGFILIMRSV